MTLSQLIDKLKQIKEKGFITTHRTNDTGIGKTFEDLMQKHMFSHEALRLVCLNLFLLKDLLLVGKGILLSHIR